MFKIKLNNSIKIGNKLIRKGSFIFLFSAKQRVREILSEDELKLIESLDGTNTYKYTDWLAIQYKEKGVSIEDLKEIITQMKKFNLDFNNKTYDQVKKELERLSEKKEKEYTKGLTLNKDYEFIDKNENYFVFSPLSEKGSIKLGEKTSWCTSRNDSYNKFDVYDFYEHTKLYYFLPMVGKEKYAIAVYNYKVDGFDVDDNAMDYIKILEITGFSESILKPWKSIKGIHYEFTGNSKKDEILNKLQQFNMNPRKVVINDDLTIDYNGDLFLNKYIFEKLPFNFNKIIGSFSCSQCISLTSLEGAPKEVRGDFDCRECGVYFTENDVMQVCDVGGKVYV